MNSVLTLPAITSVPKTYRSIAAVILPALAYFCLSLANLHFNAGTTGAVWLPSGFFLSALLLNRSSSRNSMALALGMTDFFMRLAAGVPLTPAMLFSLTVLFQSFFTAWLLLRFVENPFFFGKVRNLMNFLLFAVFLGNSASSLMAALASWALQSAPFLIAFSSWYTSSSWGIIVITPLVLSWSSFNVNDWRNLTSRQLYEGVFLFITLTLVSYLLHSYLLEGNHLLTLLDYFTFPFLIWAALRFSIRGVTVSSFILSFMILGALFLDSSHSGTGQFWDWGLLVKINLAVMAVITLFLASVVFELKQGNIVLIKREKDLVQARFNAEEANRFKSSLLLNISHELRTPLNGILGFSALLRDSLEDHEQKSMAEDISLSGKRLLHTLNSIMELAKLESTGLTAKLEQANLGLLVSNVLSQNQGLFTNNKVKLTTSINEDVIVSVDRAMFAVVMFHLLDNAAKYTPGGAVIVSVGREELSGNTRGVVKITDTGIGIPGDQLNLIFDDFKQGNEGLIRTHEGAGLGLSLCRKFTALMDGNIKAESQLGKGSTFSLSLPAASLS
ncbi:MAG: ATP-binding protein [Bacteroidota bacterium]